MAGYQLSETAEAELGGILLYLANKESAERALHVHGHFVRAFELLAEQPSSGRKRPSLTGERFRWWTVFKWIVIYDPESSPITVLRVIHGARALDQIFRPDGES
jgi:toxin ParE1/3/4